MMTAPPGSPASVELLLSVLRHHLDWCDGEELERATDGVEDWQATLLLAAHHQVHTLLRSELLRHVRDHLPEAVADTMQRELGPLMLDNLRQAWRLHRVLDLLETAGLRALAYKGPSLAAMVFGGQIRLSTDLDIVLAADDVLRARDVLIDHGFQRAPWAVDEDGSRLDPLEKDVVLWGPSSDGGGSFAVELHWRLFRTYFDVPLDFDELWSRRQDVRMPKGVVATFGSADYAFLLGVHGHVHRWTQLKWLVEFAWMLTRLDDDGWEHLERTFRRAKLTAEQAVAFTLAGWLMGSHAPRRLASSLHDLPSRHLVAAQVWHSFKDASSGGKPDLFRLQLEFFLATAADRRHRLSVAWRFLRWWWARQGRLEVRKLGADYSSSRTPDGPPPPAGVRALRGARRLWLDLDSLARAAVAGVGDGRWSRRRLRSASETPGPSDHQAPARGRRTGPQPPTGVARHG